MESTGSAEKTVQKRPFIEHLGFTDTSKAPKIDITIRGEKYYYEFLKVQREKYMIVRKSKDDSEEYRSQLPVYINLNFFGCHYFKNLLAKYKDTLESLIMSVTKNRSFNFDIEYLANLRTLQLSGDFNIGTILTKLQKPLEYLSIQVRHRNKIDYEQVYQCTGNLVIPFRYLTNEQFVKIQAKNVRMDMGYLTEENIADFLKSYQNDTIGKIVNFYTWDIDGESFFSIPKLWKLLGSNDTDYKKLLAIRHNTKRKVAHLSYNNKTLTLRNLMN
ncbi:unnamed protein product [Caenorhabditis angaria]|uniref:Uncharacterized protein n=1 Tax=Caenorhabditis angaria TaxID=860376 RepID=A0A9P1MYK7_9PELO|nr:unnamed protein product [Caenorhabditis angaria]